MVRNGNRLWLFVIALLTVLLGAVLSIQTNMVPGRCRLGGSTG